MMLHRVCLRRPATLSSSFSSCVLNGAARAIGSSQSISSSATGVPATSASTKYSLMLTAPFSSVEKKSESSRRVRSPYFSPHLPPPGDSSPTHEPIKVSFKKDPRVPANALEMPDNIDEFLQNIDTTLTEEQQAKVERIKKKIKGPHAKRSFYRDVPTFEELDRMKKQPLPVKLASNAEKLIDFALSFLPEKTGPRRTRHKKRMMHRWQQTINDHARRKQETKAAVARRLEKQRKQRELVKSIKLQAGIPVESGYKSQREKKQAEVQLGEN